MALSRRTFLRVLGSAVVGAVVAPAIPLPVPVAQAAKPIGWGAGTTTSAGALTLEMLEAAYQSCIRGREEPTLIITSASIARRYGLVYDRLIESA